MRVTVRAVKDLALSAGLPQELIDRHIDALVGLVFVTAKRERKFCRKRIKMWVYSEDVVKPPITEWLSPDMENEDELEKYELLV